MAPGVHPPPPPPPVHRARCAPREHHFSTSLKHPLSLSVSPPSSSVFRSLHVCAARPGGAALWWQPNPGAWHPPESPSKCHLPLEYNKGPTVRPLDAQPGGGARQRCAGRRCTSWLGLQNVLYALVQISTSSGSAWHASQGPAVPPSAGFQPRVFGSHTTLRCWQGPSCSRNGSLGCKIRAAA